MTANILYIDEFAFVGQGANKIEFQKEFLANANPIISSQEDGQILISSTPNSKDYFYELFDGAMKETNAWKGQKVVWYQAEHLTESWAKKEIASIGLDKFLYREYIAS